MLSDSIEGGIRDVSNERSWSLIMVGKTEYFLNLTLANAKHFVSRLGLDSLVSVHFLNRGLKILREEGWRSFIESAKKYAIKRYEVLKAKVRHWRYQHKWGRSAPIPDKLIHIDPDDVEFKTKPRFGKDISTIGTHIIGGSWDQNILSQGGSIKERGLVKFEDTTFYQSCYNHFTNGVAWEDTKRYQEVVESGKSIRPSRGTMKIEDRFVAFDKLYHEMENRGYMTQRELLNEEQRYFSPRSYPKPEYHEVEMVIARDGTLIHDDGSHRFTIARLLGIENIPVRILVRHEKWQQIREEVAMASSIDELSSDAKSHLHHPDMLEFSGNIDGGFKDK